MRTFKNRFFDDGDTQAAVQYFDGVSILKFCESIHLGRIERPEDVAGAAVFLASEDANDITQQCLNVDGGNWPS